MYSFGSSSSGVSQKDFLLEEKEFESALVKGALRESFECKLRLYNIDSFCHLNIFAILRIFFLLRIWFISLEFFSRIIFQFISDSSFALC